MAGGHATASQDTRALAAADVGASPRRPVSHTGTQVNHHLTPSPRPARPQHQPASPSAKPTPTRATPREISHPQTGIPRLTGHHGDHDQQ